MARSAMDATRFTPTGPHAHSKPTAGPKSTAGPNSSNPSETPLQKVARLREAHRRAQLNKLSRLDKAILIGRVWADRAHRITVTGLLAFTFISGIYAVVATTDMILYNRRKRREFFATQKVIYEQRLVEAEAAFAKGSPTDDHLAFLEKEYIVQQAEEKYRNKKSLFRKAKDWLFEGLKIEADAELVAGPSASEPAEVATEGGVVKAVEAMKGEKGVKEGGPSRVLEAVRALRAQRAAQEKAASLGSSGGDGSDTG